MLKCIGLYASIATKTLSDPALLNLTSVRKKQESVRNMSEKQESH